MYWSMCLRRVKMRSLIGLQDLHQPVLPERLPGAGLLPRRGRRDQARPGRLPRVRHVQDRLPERRHRVELPARRFRRPAQIRLGVDGVILRERSEPKNLVPEQGNEILRCAQDDNRALLNIFDRRPRWTSSSASSSRLTSSRCASRRRRARRSWKAFPSSSATWTGTPSKKR